MSTAKNSKIIVLSDLHLWGPTDPLYRGLLKFIDHKLTPGDKFFILGDVFDLFIGNKPVFYLRFIELIEKLRSLHTKEIEVHYIEGNHDFQLEGLFEDCKHIKLYEDELHYEWDSRRFYFCHGDKINPYDIRYKLFALFTRNLVSQCLIEVLPGKWIDRLGTKLSQQSRMHSSHFNDKKVDRLFRNFACEQITRGYNFVVMGHSHCLDDMRFRVGHHEGQYVNVGYPRQHRKYLELQQGEPFFKLKSWNDLVVPIRPDLAEL